MKIYILFMYYGEHDEMTCHKIFDFERVFATRENAIKYAEQEKAKHYNSDMIEYRIEEQLLD